MSGTAPSPDTDRERLVHPVDVAKLVVSLAFLVAAIAGIAGRWDWWPGWALLAVLVLYSVGLYLWLARADPGLARERRQDTDERNQPYERLILPLMVVLETALLVVAALDGGRFQWSTVPLRARAVGWLMVAATGIVVPWVFQTNTFASGVGRIQDNRHHHVVTAGPYRLVRHPMYAGNIVGFLGLPLALGSWWALCAGIPLALLFIVRTGLEDRMLHRLLPGYAAYAQRTRHRLIPGIW